MDYPINIDKNIEAQALELALAGKKIKAVQLIRYHAPSGNSLRSVVNKMREMVAQKRRGDLKVVD